MDATHTPGPWNVSPDGIIYSGTIATATELGFVAQGSDGVPEAKANGNVMAASPELLTACKWFVAEMEAGRIVRDIYRDALPDWARQMMFFTMSLQKAVSAIAKAEGRTC